MIVAACQHEKTKKHGTDSKGQARRRCCTCGKTMIDKPETAYGNLRITDREAATVLNLLVEGMSIRAAERISGIDKNTICDLVLRVGEKCERFMAKAIVDVKADDIQCDEIWSYVGMKERNRVRNLKNPEVGDSWTWIGVERNTKLVLAYHVGDRSNHNAVRFLHKLNNATTGHFQLTADGLGAYTNNVPFTFGNRCDFAQLIKDYRQMQSTIRYSPASIIRSEKKAIYGSPDMARVCTSHVERLNLTLRMQMRRFTRLTNGFSKSGDHHAAMQGIFFAHYNFCRKHETIKKTPAMASGLADKQWTVLELLERVA
jgi:IS1 family transposase/transposase-like protein